MTSDAKSIYLSALKNTHALEQEALQIMERQVERIQHYPEMEEILRRHIEETYRQRERLDEALATHGESASALKETVMGFMGNVAAIAHTSAQDEILKNAFANRAFENYEIAAYEALIAIAEAAGQTGPIASFRQSLQEEQRMAQQVSDLVVPITRRYIERTTSGATANR